MADGRQTQGRARARGKPAQILSHEGGRGYTPSYGSGQPAAAGPSQAGRAAGYTEPVASQIRHGAPTLTTEGRAISHRGAISGRGAVPSSSSGTGDGGNGNGSNGGARGAMRGRRTINDVLRTRAIDNPSKKGTTGHQITLQANYFKLIKKMDWTLFQYRVDFSPECHSIRLMQGLISEHKRTFGGYLFDGTQLFMINKLSSDTVELVSKHERTGEVYKIKIVRTGTIDMVNEMGLQVLNLILRRAMGGLRLQLVGRNLFDAAARIEIRDYRIELWPGYVTSIRQHETDILLCCEIAHKTMRMQTAYDILRDAQRNSRDYREAFTRQVLGCVVLTAYNNKTYRVDDVSFDKTPSHTFETRDGDKSFLQYYKEKYNIEIRDRNQPMLMSRAKKRDLRGGGPELMALVPELCQMTGLTDQMRSDFRMMRAMSDHTRLNPDRRIERLENFNRRLQNSPESAEVFRVWNTELDRRLVELPGRVLEPEKIYFMKDSEQGIVSAGDRADWTQAFRNNPMFMSVALKRWFLITPDRCQREAMDFVRTMKEAGRGMRFQMDDAEVIRLPDDRPDSYVRAIENCANKDPQLIMCVVTNNKPMHYTAIKKKCCVERAIPTQVMVHRTITPKGGNARGLLSVATKVVIQLNCKLGGIPWKVKIPMNGIMTIGFDVCHDTNDKSKSFGAMVCSMEDNYKEAPRFFSCVSSHQHGEEVSNYLALNVAKAMNQYRSDFGTLPKKIFFYRDGVGEGQLQYVYEHEVSSVVAKLKDIYKSAGVENVAFSFIVVNKRINTRLFHKRQNPKPGTIVDDVITLPERNDFYLVSQHVGQGTVSPTAYNIIYDTSGLSPDRIQQVTYKMCHVYYNWSGTTRVPSVCQYAHKLAFLVSQFIHQAPSNILEKQLFFL